MFTETQMNAMTNEERLQIGLILLTAANRLLDQISARLDAKMNRK